MAATKIQCQTISISAPMNYVYEKTLELTLFPGFTAVEPPHIKQGCITPEYVSSLNMMFKFSKTNEVDALLLTSQPFVKESQHFTEAGLINRLDSLGIGRPSTFSMLVDIIQTRNYVVRKNIEATTVDCNIYTFTNSNKQLDVSSALTKFGGERNKLVITPLGSIVCEYLIGEFAELFSYDYTNRLECELDAVASGQLQWHTVCEKCLTYVNALVTPLMKVFYPLDNGHTLYFHTDKKTGKVSPLIRKANGAHFEYKRVKPDIQINFERLKRGEYTVADLAVLPEGEHVIGKRGDKDIVVKSGQYGIYAECGDIRIPMTSVSMHLDAVLLKLEEKEAKPKTSLVRELTGELSVRNGPHGHYIYFMTKKMKKPKFFDILGFGQDYLTCNKETLINWIVGKYKIKLSLLE
jgi:DNA topoisomerase-1